MYWHDVVFADGAGPLPTICLPLRLWCIQTETSPCKKQTECINSMIRNFIWNGKKARISMKQLTLGYEEGGLNPSTAKPFYSCDKPLY